jgi:hypothetical protein
MTTGEIELANVHTPSNKLANVHTPSFANEVELMITDALNYRPTMWYQDYCFNKTATIHKYFENHLIVKYYLFRNLYILREYDYNIYVDFAKCICQKYFNSKLFNYFAEFCFIYKIKYNCKKILKLHLKNKKYVKIYSYNQLYKLYIFYI